MTLRWLTPSFLVIAIGFAGVRAYSQAAPPVPPQNPQASVAPGREAPSSPGPQVGPDGKISRTNLLDGIIEVYDYTPEGKRDPFASFVIPKAVATGPVQGPIFPLQRFDIEQLKLTGIMTGGSQPRAMFTDPNGKVHFVTKNVRIGRNNGYVAEIREGEVVIAEPLSYEGRLSYQTRVLRLEGR